MPVAKRPGEWLVLSVTKHQLELECGVRLVIHRSTQGSFWRFAIMRVGSDESFHETRTYDPREAKRVALRALALRLDIANGQTSAALVDIGTQA